MRTHHLFAAVLAGTLTTAAAHAQSWDQLVTQRWPGDSIRKVTEAQFEAFLGEHLATLGDKDGALRAFLTAQHRAYGHPATGALWFVNRGVPTVLPHSSTEALVIEGPEPNDDPVLGGTPTLFNCADHGAGVIDPPGTTYDSDWWQFSVAAPTRVKLITSRGNAAGGYVTDTILELYDSTSTLIASDDDGGVGLYSLIDRTLAPGTYYANVRPFSTFTTTGSYGVDMFCGAPGAQSIAEGPEPNNDPAQGGTPTVFNLGDTGQGAIDVGGDHDWWQFTVTGPVNIVAETNAGATGTAIGDTTLRLRDSAGTQLAFDDDGGAGLYSRIAYSLTAAGTYYLDVRAYSSTRTGTYSVSVIDANAGGPTVATYTTDATGCAGSNGTPTIAARYGELPHIGTTFGVDVTGMPASAVAVGNLGFTQVLPGPIQLPLDLASIGAPGCLLSCDIGGSFPLVVDGAGAASWYLWIPNDANLLGLTFYQQVIDIDAGVNALGVTTSNLGTGVFGNAVQ